MTLKKNYNRCCDIPCHNNIIEDGRCVCVNGIKGITDGTMGSVTVNYHFCSKEEREELIQYLNNKCWDYEDVSKFIDE